MPHLDTRESNGDLQLRLQTIGRALQRIIVPVAMVQYTNRILLPIFLTVFSYNLEGILLLIPHVNCYWQPENIFLDIFFYKTLHQNNLDEETQGDDNFSMDKEGSFKSAKDKIHETKQKNTYCRTYDDISSSGSPPHTCGCRIFAT